MTDAPDTRIRSFTDGMLRRWEVSEDEPKRILGEHRKWVESDGKDGERADLSFAKDLTREQLDEACGDAKTKLPDDLKDYKIKPCPEASE